jgi:acyl carrier protein
MFAASLLTPSSRVASAFNSPNEVDRYRWQGPSNMKTNHPGQTSDETLRIEGRMDRNDIVGIVEASLLSTIDEAGFLRPAEVGETTALVGPESVLDSMALVTLVLDTEQRLHEHAGVSVSLMSEDALSRRRSPFRTVGSLADYIAELAAPAPAG